MTGPRVIVELTDEARAVLAIEDLEAEGGIAGFVEGAVRNAIKAYAAQEGYERGDYRPGMVAVEFFVAGEGGGSWVRFVDGEGASDVGPPAF